MLVGTCLKIRVVNEGKGPVVTDSPGSTPATREAENATCRTERERERNRQKKDRERQREREKE